MGERKKGIKRVQTTGKERRKRERERVIGRRERETHKRVPHEMRLMMNLRGIREKKKGGERER